MTKDEQLYLEAKEKYYLGYPIMSDEKFDELELTLKNLNSIVINIVGSEETSTKEKINHFSPMLSLAKIKAKINSKPPFEDFIKWIEKINVSNVSIEPKFDGNACNILYRNGKLFKALTRGNGISGTDITHIIQYHVPNIISDNRDLEVRGEVLIEKEIFNKKYFQYKNPRNYVAGVLHRDNVNINEIKDLIFIPFEVKIKYKNKYIYANHIQWLQEQQFAYLPTYFTVNFQKHIILDEFNNIFYKMLDYRDNKSKYLLDGFVVKVIDSSERLRLGENSHDPEWALAVKFEPIGIVTKINNIEWSLSKRRELIPIGILEPVDLEGTVVKRVSLYNYRFVKENQCFPGAEIELVKAGDIIPQVVKVITESDLIESWIPINCPICGEKTIIEEVHIKCINLLCTGSDKKKFIYGVSQLNLDFFGTKTLENLYDCGITKPLEIFKIDKDFMIKNGFGNGKNTERLLQQLQLVKSITLEQIILTLGINDLGKTIAKELAKWYSKVDYNFSGLQKNIIQDFLEYGKSYVDLISSVEFLENLNITIIYPEKLSNTLKQRSYEMTGSPKSSGFATKELFVLHALTLNFINEQLTKTSEYLITDNYSSSSSKMKKAQKLGVKIITYSDFLKENQKI